MLKTQIIPRFHFTIQWFNGTVIINDKVQLYVDFISPTNEKPMFPKKL